jgi:hypothetical protein
MPAQSLCQKFYGNALSSVHQYRKDAIVDSTTALINGASLTLTSIGRHLSGDAQVKNKIKRVDRLLGNPALHKDIPVIFNKVIAQLTAHLSWCLIAVDWSGYPYDDNYILRASLICDGRSIPLMSLVVPSKKQNNVEIQKEFLNTLHQAVTPGVKVYIVTDAGFQIAWFNHVKSLGWDFIGRVRGTVKYCLHGGLEEKWLNATDIQGKAQPQYLGEGTLGRYSKTRCIGHFYLHKRPSKGRKYKRPKGQISSTKTVREQSKSAKDPWLIFTSTSKFKAREMMTLYSRRMQIEQNFRDEKSERFGFGLRASRSRDGKRFLALSLLATLASVVLWLLGYHAEKKGFHRWYQANSVKKRRVISFLTLAENILRHAPHRLWRLKLDNILAQIVSTYQSMVLTGLP